MCTVVINAYGILVLYMFITTMHTTVRCMAHLNGSLLVLVLYLFF